MKKYLQHILILLAAVMILVPSCKREAARVIPRSKLAKIYAEMFVTDQWIQSKPGLRTIADTSLVYEPILQKYGYDSDDYQYSIDRYMDDPERFSRILRTTAEILDKEIKSLQKQHAELKLHEQRKKEIASIDLPDFQLYDEFISPDGLREWADSLDVAWDTLMNVYKFGFIIPTDTIYEGPRVIVRDTIAVHDSVATDSLVTDSLAVADFMIAMDSIKIPGISKKALDTPVKFVPLRKDTITAASKMPFRKRPEAPVRERQ